MIWPWVAALLYLLLSARVMVDARLAAGMGRAGAQIALRVWGLRMVFDMPLSFSLDRKTAKGGLDTLRGCWTILRAALRRIAWGQTDVRIRAGLDDAAHTALLFGGASALSFALSAAAGRRFPCRITVRPDFRTPGFAIKARCIFSFMPGDIMFAALKAAVKKTQREGFSWLSIPLRA